MTEVSLAHLDRPFDYSVPADLDAEAVAGVRVKVPFAGRDVAGFIVERTSVTDRQRLQPIRRVVSPEPVLTGEIHRLCRELADRYAGTEADVLRLAIPSRHARTEKRDLSDGSAIKRSSIADFGPFLESADAEIATYPGFAGFLTRPQGRAVLSLAPGLTWVRPIVAAIGHARSRGEGVVVCLPDATEVDRLNQALQSSHLADLGEGHAVLKADLGPAARYAAYLRLLRGHQQIAIGTRAAAYAPVKNLGLVIIYDDGDDLYAEPRAPYCHTRDALLVRAEQTGASVLLLGHARSAEAEYLVRTGWAESFEPPREFVRSQVRIEATGDPARLDADAAALSARLPSQALRAIRTGVESGPVLVQVARSGYATRLCCERCRESASCAHCRGPLRQRGATTGLACGWCARPVSEFSCRHCGGKGLRAPTVGHHRIAEELGRSLPGVPIQTSSGERRLADLTSDSRCIVVSTVGTEPMVRPLVGTLEVPGYACVVILDSWQTLARSDLRAEEEAMRRWSNALALVRRGGRAVVVGESTNGVVQALVRWDPAGLARRLIDERREAHLPPASRMASIQGTEAALDSYLEALVQPPGTEILGPVLAEPKRAMAAASGSSGFGAGELVSDESHLRYLLRVPRSQGRELARQLKEAQSARSARKQEHIRVQLDPEDLG